MHRLLVLAFAAIAHAGVVPRDDTCASEPTTQTLSNGVICTSSCLQDRPGGNYADSYTGTFEACVQSCGDDVNCVTAQFREDNGYCYYKNAVNSLTASNNTDTVDCCPGVYTDSDGRICTPTCGQDRPGGDYNHTYAGNFQACIKACGDDPNCVTAQYSQPNGYCYFKDSYHDFSAQQYVDTVDCCAGPQTFGSRTCTTTCMTDRNGGDYANQHTGTQDACIQLCGSDSNCVTASFHIDTGYCYLKNSANPSFSSLNADIVDCS